MKQFVNYQKFDMARGVAAVLVLVAHIFQIFWYRFLGVENFLSDLSGTFARHAVLIFFLLSGYLITLSIIGNIQKNSTFIKSEYISSRLARIYPPLLGAILITILAWGIIYLFDLPGKSSYRLPTDIYVAREKFTISISDILSALNMSGGLLYSNGPLWSLYIEFHIYILAMFAATIITSKLLWQRIVFSAVLVLLFIYWVTRDHFFALFTSVWMIGSLAAIISRRSIRIKVVKFARIVTILIFIFTISLLFLSPHTLSASNPNTEVNWEVQISLSFFYAYIIFFTTSLDKILINSLMKAGGFSYSLYIVHFPLLLLALSVTQTWIGDSLNKTAVVSMFLFITIIIFASWFSKLFEQQSVFKPVIQRLLLSAINFFHKVTLILSSKKV